MTGSTTPNPKPTRFMEACGLVVNEVSSTHVTGWIDLTADFHQPFGIVHGGVYASAVESAASMGATAAVSDKGLIAVGVNNNTNFLRSMTEGRVIIEARAISQSRTQQLWEVEITDEQDRLVATGQLRLQNVTPR